MAKQLYIVSAATLAGLAGSTFAQIGGTPIAVSGLSGTSTLDTGSANGTLDLAYTGTAFAGAGIAFTRSSTINDNGDVLFTGYFAGGQGVWRRMAGAGANSNLARTTNALPAPGGGAYSNGTGLWGATNLDSAGNALFGNVLVTGADAVLARVSTGGASQLATRGTLSGTVSTGRLLPTNTVAGVEEQGNTNALNMMLMNRSGQSLMIGFWQNSAADSGSGLYLGTPVAGNYDSMTLLVHRNGVLPGIGNVPAPVMDFIGGTPSFNDNGRFAATIDVLTASVPTTGQNRGVFTNRNGTLENLMMRSTAAPFLPSNQIIGTIGSISPSMNNSGQIAVTTSLANNTGGTSITQANDAMIVRFDNPPGGPATTFTLQEGAASDRSTGGGQNIRLGGQLNGASGFGISTINGNGTILNSSSGNTDALGAVLPAGGGNSSLFLINGATNAISTIALTGDTAPGTPGTFLSFNAGSRALNDNNQVAFLATLNQNATAGITTANDLVLYMTDLSGNLVLIAREGSALPGDPVGGRTVSLINFNLSVNGNPTNGQDGRGMSLNNNSQLIFQVGFSDGNSGLFMVQVPTPGSAALLGLGLVASGRRRR